MRTMYYLIALSILAIMPLSAQVPNPQKPSAPPAISVAFQAAEFSSDDDQLIVKKQREHAIWSALVKARVQGVEEGRIGLIPSAEDLAELESAQCETCPVNDEKQTRVIGVNQRVGIYVDLDDERNYKQDQGVGRGKQTGENAFVWTTSIRSEGATAMRIRFTKFDLGNAAMFIYNDFGQMFGPYTATGPNQDGKFWSHTVNGDNVWIQIHATNEIDIDDSSFEIAGVAHMGSAFLLGESDPMMGKADCSANVDCVENAQCYTDWSELKGARKATAYLIYSEDEDGKTYGCTGGTLNDNNGAHRKAWLLTANHCINTEKEANSLEARFGYKADCGTCSSSFTDSVLGADLHATGKVSDFSLLELSRLPSGWGLLGWTNGKVRNNHGLDLYRISHPKHQPQMFSQHQVDAYSWVDNAWIKSENVIGTTEGVSSGAPIFKAGGIVVGQLRGVTWSGPTYDRCVNADNWRTNDGAFNAYWKSVRPYLASASSTSYKMHVSEIRPRIKTLNLGFVVYKVGVADITIVDELGNAIPNATVTGEFSNGLNGVQSEKTNDAGVATITYDGLNTNNPNFTFCVLNVSHQYFNTYNSNANVVTCADR